MEKLSFQDAAFLRMESAARPFHVAGLMIFRQPENAGPQFLRRLARRLGRLNELWPVFRKKLQDPSSLRNPCWVAADDYDPNYHIFHYALPAPGRMDDLITLVSRTHERMLDRHRPLWELHLIEGLTGDRFAVYCKVHHALVDGVGALQMVNALFSDSPDQTIDFHSAGKFAERQHHKRTLAKQLVSTSRELRKHYASIPQVSSLLAAMGRDALTGKQDVPALPFTAPRTIFNTGVDARREIILTELPLNRIRQIAKSYGATVNDILVAICGGALRKYLLEQGKLPLKSLEAGVPISIKQKGEQGNQVSFIICPLFTDVEGPSRRVKGVIKVMSKAKKNFRDMSSTAAQDFTNMLMMPTILLTLSGRAGQVAPAFNAIISNVPGSKKQLFLEGAPMESMYPLSVVTDGMAINLTVVSYQSKLCFAITSCPTHQPGIGTLASSIKQSYKEVAAAARELGR
ncbi:MAG: wax ester/triacylglycerol synthase family O-acyltransferase [Halioglobus sp.]